jgi:predicted nucleotidyltransferase component of viral defense system
VAVPSRRARSGGQTLITIGAITKIADREGVGAIVVERVYMLTHLIDALAKLDPPPGLVFKGGTALRLCFYEDFRYSADLDFSLVDLNVEDATQLLTHAAAKCVQEIGFPQLQLTDTTPAWLVYTGPLGREREIKVDLADDELVLDTAPSAVIKRYSDQPDDRPKLSTYTLLEITAEKLRCVIQRRQCRDLSDLHRLLVQEQVDVDQAWELFEAKAQAKNIEPSKFEERLNSREQQYRKQWDRELGDLDPGHVDANTVFRELRRALRDVL